MACKKALRAVDDQDRISNLPDCVLCHILSFLPTKYSLRTRLLSTRWKPLFSFVPNLDFEFFSYAYKNANSTSFIHCVDSVFTLYNVSRMNKFRLGFRLWGGKLDPFPIDSWISAAIKHCVRQIDFDIDSLFPLTVPLVPLDLFSCETLTDLKLKGTSGFELTIAIPSSVCLPCLKTCHLENICFDDQSARRLFQSCSSLELLDLTDCRVGQGVTLLDISSETLKHLGICRPGNDYKILLNVPNLLKFEYGYNYTQIEFLGLESLKSSVDARIFSGRKPIFYYTQGSVVLELIRAICHVQKLYLDGETTEAFLRTDQELPKFNNLTSLAFGPISSHASRLLPSLLDNSPQLESLSFDQGGEKYGIEVQDMYMLPEHVPACVAQHPKEVEFRSPFGLDFDIKLIKYFLKYAKNLRRMKICSKSDWNEQFEISSASCEVIFSYPCMVERKMVLKQECTTSCLVRQLMSSSQ